MLRAVLGSAVVTVTIAVSAVAADLPGTKDPLPEPIYTPPPFAWAGLYVGLNAGGAFGATKLRSTPLPQPQFGILPFSQGLSPDGFIGGAQIGYSFQTGSLVYGLETDFQGASIMDAPTLTGLPFASGGIIPSWTNRGTEKLDWFGTVRARLGYAIGRTLLFATGGLIYGDVKSSSFTAYTPTLPFKYIGSSSGAQAGYTFGGGVEYAFTNNWTIRAEGLYFDMGNKSYTASPNVRDPPFVVAHSADLKGRIFRVGLNYKF
jgi:outer membrane immunogenic protein